MNIPRRPAFSERRTIPMQVEYTARQATITAELRQFVEEGLTRVAQVMGARCTAHLVLTAEKYRHTAEITVQCRRCQIVGLCESPSAETAVRDALSKVETQALRRKDRQRAQKRLPKEEKLSIEPRLARPRKVSKVLASAPEHAIGAKKGRNGAKKLPTPVIVHSPAERAHIPEPHIVHSQDAMAPSPMSLEEAVKEAEQRDRDVFVFRNNTGAVSVLHRRRDGTMELIQAI
jgi:putative sigma-54 modulation protein